MKPVEFVMWVRGAVDVCGDEPPSKEQWDRIRSATAEAIGHLVASKMLDRAEDQRIRDEIEAEKNRQMAELYKQSFITKTIGPASWGTTTATAISDTWTDATTTSNVFPLKMTA